MHFVFFINILLTLIIEIEPMISTSVASRGRIQSMRPLLRRTKINTNSQSARLSSSSSASSLQSIPVEIDTKTKPVGPSDLVVKDVISKTVSFQSEAVVMDESLEMDVAHSNRRASRISLQEASVGTHSAKCSLQRETECMPVLEIFYDAMVYRLVLELLLVLVLVLVLGIKLQVIV